MSEKPEEPTDLSALEQQLELSYLDEEAVHMHELYKSLIRAGFRERQALLLVAMIANDAQDDGVYIQDMTVDHPDYDQDFDQDPELDSDEDPAD
jgi:hypothetical protein